MGTMPGDVYLSFPQKTYQDQIATLKDELKEKKNIMLKLLHSDQRDLKACETLENPTTLKNINSSSSDDGNNKTP